MNQIISTICILTDSKKTIYESMRFPKVTACIYMSHCLAQASLQTVQGNRKAVADFTYLRTVLSFLKCAGFLTIFSYNVQRVINQHLNLLLITI